MRILGWLLYPSILLSFYPSILLSFIAPMYLVTIITRDRGTFELISHQATSHQAEQEALEACRYGLSHSIVRSTVVSIGEASSRC